MQWLLDHFRLPPAQLSSVVSTIAANPVTDYTFHAVAGSTDYPNISRVDLAYTLSSKETHTIPILVKKCVWQNRSESVDYRYLSTADVPTPLLYAALPNTDGDEILFLEYLTAIGFDDQRESEWRQMLTLLARFNACPVTPAYAKHLYHYEQGAQLDGTTWYTGLDPNFDRARTEADLFAGGADPASLPALLTIVANLFALIDAQPRGLLHQDFHRENIGWRGDRAGLVVFDLHKNALGPRFADVASYLGVPDWSRRASYSIPGATAQRRAANNSSATTSPSTPASAAIQSPSKPSAPKPPPYSGRTKSTPSACSANASNTRESIRYWSIADTQTGSRKHVENTDWKPQPMVPQPPREVAHLTFPVYLRLFFRIFQPTI